MAVENQAARSAWRQGWQKTSRIDLGFFRFFPRPADFELGVGPQRRMAVENQAARSARRQGWQKNSKNCQDFFSLAASDLRISPAWRQGGTLGPSASLGPRGGACEFQQLEAWGDVTEFGFGRSEEA